MTMRKSCLFLAACLLSLCLSCRKATQPTPTTPTAASTATPVAAPITSAPPAPPKAPTPIADQFRATASDILAKGREGRGAYEKLSYLTDRIGHRIAGSKPLDQAVAWAQKTMTLEGHENVRAEKVMVGYWERGELSLDVVSPAPQKLAAITLGLSPATPNGGITGEVVVVQSFEELDKLGEARVKGKIVLFNHPMGPFTTEGGSGYGEASKYRTRGPAAAAKLGASAALTRSATARSLRSPHTGVTVFEPNERRIPAAAVSTEDADMIARLAASGPVTVKLVLRARDRGKVASANVLGELRGRERPNEIVLLGAHLDSWDVGQGAQDDGAGCVIMMEALSILRRERFVPRRTIRVVLYTNEEHGMDGAKAYAKDHEAELANHVAAIESDGGSFEPVGLSYEGKPEDPAFARLSDIVTLLAPLGATKLEAGHSGTDLIPLGAAGIPRLGHRTNGATYFDYHHTEADTLDKVDPKLLQDNAAMMAAVAWVLAEMPQKLAE
jgi:Zn-dependent M28 family amino/carboxypeptidase